MMIPLLYLLIHISCVFLTTTHQYVHGNKKKFPGTHTQEHGFRFKRYLRVRRIALFLVLCELYLVTHLLSCQHEQATGKSCTARNYTKLHCILIKYTGKNCPTA